MVCFKQITKGGLLMYNKVALIVFIFVVLLITLRIAACLEQ